MPGTPGFDGAHLLIEGTIKKYGWLVSIAILIGNVLTAALLLRAFQQIFISASKRTQKPFIYSPRSSTLPSPKNERIIAIVICILLVGIGFNTAPWLHIIDQSAHRSLHPISYNEHKQNQ